MSAATAQKIVVLPKTKQRSWATMAIVIIDVMALELALFFGCLVRFVFHGIFPIRLGTAQYQGLALGVLTLPLVYYWVGLYPGYGVGAAERLRARVYATLAVFALLLTWNYAFADRQWSRGVLLLTMLFALILAPALEAPLRRFLIARGVCGVPVVILGAGHTGSLVAKALQKHSDLGFVPIGILDDNSQKWGMTIHGVRVIGPLSAAEGLERLAKVALIAMPRLNRDLLAELIHRLSFASIIVVPDLFGIQSLWITSRDLGGVLGLEVRKNLLVRSNRVLKRVLDYSVAVPFFILTAPFVAFCAAWIKILSPGPAFFQQQREGQGGKRITIHKLRTMYPDAERVLTDYLDEHPIEKALWSQFYKLRADPRVLPRIGWFLRRYSLDELPQLWNVLKGEMSLVGPRPFPYYHLNSFPQAFRTLRRSVMPGVTGLWQVSERSDGDLKVQEAEDTYYIRNWSLWLDIYVLLRTVQTVLRPKGAY